MYSAYRRVGATANALLVPQKVHLRVKRCVSETENRKICELFFTRIKRSVKEGAAYRSIWLYILATRQTIREPLLV